MKKSPSFITITGEAPEEFDERLQAGIWLREYFREIIGRRRTDPGDDLVSVTVRRREKVIVVGTVVVSLILAVGLIGMAVVEWL